MTLVTYGYELESTGDEFFLQARNVAAEWHDAATPGRYLVVSIKF
jgi:hypothetical protein